MNAGRRRPRSCDFEVVSLIKELIKEKLHASEQITEERKGTGSEKKKEQIWSGEGILAAHQFLKCQRVVFLIGRGASWHTGDGYKSCKRKKQKPATHMCEQHNFCPAPSCGVSTTKH